MILVVVLRHPETGRLTLVVSWDVVFSKSKGQEDKDGGQ